MSEARSPLAVLDALHAAQQADADVIRLAREAVRLHALTRPVDDDPAFTQWCETLDRLVKSPATTLPALAAKAVAYMDWLDPKDDPDLLPPDDLLDTRVQLSLLRDLLALAGPGAPAAPTRAATKVPNDESGCPVALLARRYGPLAARWLDKDHRGTAAAARDESSLLEAEMGALANMAVFERAQSATGVIFQLMCVWTRVEALASRIKDKEASVDEDAAELLLTSAIRFLEREAGVSSTDFGRAYSGPNWEHIPADVVRA